MRHGYAIDPPSYWYKTSYHTTVLSIAFARWGSILPIVRELTYIKKQKKTYSLRIRSGM